MEAVEKQIEFGEMDDLIKIKNSAIDTLNDISKHIGLFDEENCAFLFGNKDEEGNICFQACYSRKKLAALSKNDSVEGIIRAISLMANSYGPMKKMVCCMVSLFPSKPLTSEDFIKNRHIDCISQRNLLNNLPGHVGCLFAFGSLDFLSGNALLRFFSVDNLGVLECKHIESYGEIHHLPEVIFGEMKGSKC